MLVDNFTHTLVYSAVTTPAAVTVNYPILNPFSKNANKIRLVSLSVSYAVGTSPGVYLVKSDLVQNSDKIITSFATDNTAAFASLNVERDHKFVVNPIMSGNVTYYLENATGAAVSFTGIIVLSYELYLDKK